MSALIFLVLIVVAYYVGRIEQFTKDAKDVMGSFKRPPK
jgi:hypothetical protein